MKRKDACAIALHGNHVNLEFARGTELEDAYEMLEGIGKKIKTFEDL